MKKLFALSLIALTLAGCNTIAGIGKDVQKAGQVVDTAFEAQFGELYLRIKYRGRQAKVKFEEIEKLPA